MKNPRLMQMLKARRWSVTKLARHIGCAHTQVSMVLNNTPGRGHRVRPKLAILLKPEELALLGWDAQGNIVQTVSGQLVNNNVTPQTIPLAAGRGEGQNEKQTGE